MPKELRNKNGFPKLNIRFGRIIVPTKAEVQDRQYRIKNDLREDYSPSGFIREVIAGARAELRRY